MPKLLERIRSFFSQDWNNTGETVPGGLDAVDQPSRRRSVGGQPRSLDDEIPDRKRTRVTQTARNVSRNFELAAWAIRKHLDFVSRFGFRMRTGIESFDRDVESFVEWWARPGNFGVNGRHSLAKSIRLAETMRCVDGDFFFLKLADGRVQGIEGDRVRTPDQHRNRNGASFDADRVFNGVELNKAGRPTRYAVHSRKRPAGFDFDRWVPARSIFAHGFFDRYDQTRGVSPVVASLPRLQDVYEGFDYALARAKVAQLFGLVLTRDVEETGLGQTTQTDDDGDGTNDRKKVKLGQGPVVLDMNPGEDARFLENKTPAPEFQQFEAMMIGVSLKSLDIPFSFYDEAYTNFFGSKAALVLYLQSVRDKRADVVELLRKLTIWRLRLAIQDGDILLPRSIQTIDDIRHEWVPTGIPWFDPRDVRGDIDAIKAGLKTRTEVRRERFGDDWRDVATVLAEEERLIDELGIRVTMEAEPDAAGDRETELEESSNA